MPQVKDAPQGLNNLLESVYQKNVADEGAEKASKLAWGAAKKAGWEKSEDKWSKNEEEVNVVKCSEIVLPKDMLAYEAIGDDESEKNKRDIDETVDLGKVAIKEQVDSQLQDKDILKTVQEFTKKEMLKKLKSYKKGK